MKKIIVFCTVLLFGASAFAKPSDKFTGALLWKISGNGLEKPSYILGEYRFNAAVTFDGLDGAREALESSSQIVISLPLADRAAFEARFQRASMMPEGESYQKLLPKEEYERIDNTLKAMTGAGLDRFGMVNPYMLNQMLLGLIFMSMNPDFDPAKYVSLSTFAHDLAFEKGMREVALGGTVEEQIGDAFSSEPLKAQADNLACSLQNFTYTVNSTKQLSEYYASGDLTGLYSLTFDPNNPCPLYMEEQRIKLKRNNDRWLEKLPAVMAEAPSFICTEALNLAGEAGLLYRLDQMGYTVEAVK